MSAREIRERCGVTGRHRNEKRTSFDLPENRRMEMEEWMRCPLYIYIGLDDDDADVDGEDYSISFVVSMVLVRQCPRFEFWFGLYAIVTRMGASAWSLIHIVQRNATANQQKQYLSPRQLYLHIGNSYFKRHNVFDCIFCCIQSHHWHFGILLFRDGSHKPRCQTILLLNVFWKLILACTRRASDYSVIRQYVYTQKINEREGKQETEREGEEKKGCFTNICRSEE